MKNKKVLVIATIILLVVGFASVSTNLVINGFLSIGESNDFKIIFTSANLDGKTRDDFISKDKQHIVFTSNILMNVTDESILSYEVTNTSKNYDAEVKVTCSSGDEDYITFSYTPQKMEVPAGRTKSGTLTAVMKKATEEDKNIPIECTLIATPIERNKLGDDYIEPFSKAGTMMVAINEYDNQESIWKYRDNVSKVVFENEMSPYKIKDELIFDISASQDRSVMAYLVAESEEEVDLRIRNLIEIEAGMTLEQYKQYAIEEGGMTEEEFESLLEQLKNDYTGYILYIQSETGVKANEDSSNLFYRFRILQKIEGLEYLSTKNVINMSNMFSDCVYLEEIDLSNFDTSNVTNMSHMFSQPQDYPSTLLTSLDLRKFDTSKVTTMYGMFFGQTNLRELYINSFNTSNVTNMSTMFYGCASLYDLDLSSFDTSNVTNMDMMFQNMKSTTIVKVRDATVQNWILTSKNSRPSGWSSDNVIIQQ